MKIALFLLFAMPIAAYSFNHRNVLLNDGGNCFIVNPPATLLPADADTSRFCAEWSVTGRDEGSRLCIAALTPRRPADINYCGQLFLRWLSDVRQSDSRLYAAWLNGKLNAIVNPFEYSGDVWVSPVIRSYVLHDGCVVSRSDYCARGKLSAGAEIDLLGNAPALVAYETEQFFKQLSRLWTSDIASTDSVVTLRLLLNERGPISASILAPVSLTPTDSQAVVQLRRIIAHMPAALFTTLFTEQGTPLRQRIVRGSLQGGEWTFADISQSQFAAMKPSKSPALPIAATVAAALFALFLVYKRKKRRRANRVVNQ